MKRSPHAISRHDLDKADKQLKKNFKSWFKTEPLKKMGQYCQKMSYDLYMTNLAKDIAEKIQSKGILEGRQPKTLNSVAFIMINQRLNNQKLKEQLKEFRPFVKEDQEILSITSTSKTTVNGAHEIIRNCETEFFPDSWLTNEEKQAKMNKHKM